MGQSRKDNSMTLRSNDEKNGDHYDRKEKETAMNYSEYKNIICTAPETRGLGYEIAFVWLNPGRLPIGVVSLNGRTDKVIRVPIEELNPHSGGINTVLVIAIGLQAFKDSTEVTDVIFSSNII